MRWACRRWLVLALRTVNRLISYVRSRKGQYWLSEYRIDVGRCADMFVSFDGKARFDGSDWFRFGPSRHFENLGRCRFRRTGAVRADEWRDIRDFVVSSRRPPLARTLLAGAETLAADGHSRSALTEAVTALEVALYTFARNPAAERAFGPMLAKRMGIGVRSISRWSAWACQGAFATCCRSCCPTAFCRRTCSRVAEPPSINGKQLFTRDSATYRPAHCDRAYERCDRSATSSMVFRSWVSKTMPQARRPANRRLQPTAAGAIMGRRG